MLLKADFHLHVDGPLYKEGRNNHGEDPRQLAEAILAADLDVVAPLEHYQIGDRAFEAKESIESLSDSRGQASPLIYPATELSLDFDGFAYHVGIVFREWFDRCNTPSLPDRGDSLIDVIAALRKRHSLLTVLFHPTWKDHQHPSRVARTTALMSLSGLFDGVELFNGSYLYNGSFNHSKREALATALSNHQAHAWESAPAPMATSDAHRAPLVGSVHTRVDIVDAGESDHDLRRVVFEAIQAKRTKPVIVDPSIKSHVQQTLATLRHPPQRLVVYE